MPCALLTARQWLLDGRVERVLFGALDELSDLTGYLWYRTDVTLSAAEAAGPVQLMFPGLFNEAWLYVNGQPVAHRDFPRLWWLADYKFEWDVPLGAALRPGTNTIALRLHNPHHLGGMFRRPFLYRQVIR